MFKLQLTRGQQKSSHHCLCYKVSSRRLYGNRFFIPVSVNSIRIVFLDTSPSHMFLGHPGSTNSWYVLLWSTQLPISSNYHITPTQMASNMPVWLTCFSEDITHPLLLSDNFLYWLHFRAISTHKIVHPSHLNSRTVRALMLLNFPSCTYLLYVSHLNLSHWLRNFKHLHISCQIIFLASFVI